MPESKQILVPELGAQGEAVLVELLVAVGDAVREEQAIATLESEKATLEVPSPFAGVIRELAVVPGTPVSAGSLLALVEVEGAGAMPAAPAPPPALAPPPSPATPAATMPAAQATALHASPAARKLARELGVELRHVDGSQPHGRIGAEDVQRHAGRAAPRAASDTAAATAAATATVAAAAPRADSATAASAASFGAIEVRPLSRIRRLSAAHLARCWSSIPQVTQHESADITELEKLRLTLNSEPGSPKLTLLPFLMKASAVALRQFPLFNASLDEAGEQLVLKQYVHIGFAADTDEGLVVPVIRDVDRKGVLDLAREAIDLAARARAGALRPADMSGGCFSLSSLGGIGGTAFTPIVNGPEVAILGLSQARLQPVWDGTQFAPRLMLPLSLSYDHRVIDGALAARFVAFLARALADIRRLLL